MGQGRGIDLLEEGGFYSGLKPAQRKRLERIIETYKKKSPDVATAKYQFNRTVRTLRYQIPNPTNYVTKLVEIGYSDVLEDIGIIYYQDSQISIDENKLLELLSEHGNNARSLTKYLDDYKLYLEARSRGLVDISKQTLHALSPAQRIKWVK
jgi:hypothetical protein